MRNRFPMTTEQTHPRRPGLRLLAGLAALGFSAILATGAENPPSAPSESVTVNILRLLVQQGIFTQEQAEGLVRQAEAEAAAAKET
ncbi:hypothetical protein OpiT1DRAFT_03261, partial [Opitutaceae bacterium TAV1]